MVGVLKNKPLLGGARRRHLDVEPQGAGAADHLRRASTRTTTSVGRVFVRIGGDGLLVGAAAAAWRTWCDGTLLRRHLGVENFKVEGEEGERATRSGSSSSIIKMLLLGTGLLSLFVGGINIMNIMLVTVTERTREIGVRRAIGATPGAIMMQFLLEAAFIAFTGGVIGVLGGSFLTWLSAVILDAASATGPCTSRRWSIVLGLGLSLLDGRGLRPVPGVARRAARSRRGAALRIRSRCGSSTSISRARSCVAHKFRSLLTVLSITIGAFSIVLMSSLAQSGLDDAAAGHRGARRRAADLRRPQARRARRGASATSYTRGITVADRDSCSRGCRTSSSTRCSRAWRRKDMHRRHRRMTARADLVAADGDFFDI